MGPAGRGPELAHLAEPLVAGLDAAQQAREQGLTACRRAIRACGLAIRAVHRREPEAAGLRTGEAQRALREAQEALSPHPRLAQAGFLHDAEKEFAEAQVTLALVRGQGLPEPDRVGVPPAAYLKGTAEAIGELRRHILDLMRRGELARCEELLAAMDDIYTLLVSMDYPDGITFGLRRLTDVARSIIERTRGDYTVSVIQSSLHRALEEHADKLRPTS